MSKTIPNIFDVKIIVFIYQKICNYVTAKKKHNNLNKTIIDFFNFNKACPEKIENCSKLRSEYNKSIEILKHNKICTGCTVASIQQKYISLIKLNLNSKKLNIINE